MDFFKIKVQETKGVPMATPNFLVGRSEDLMVRGKDFYAVWDEQAGLWSTDTYAPQRLIDKELWEFCNKDDRRLVPSLLEEFDNGVWKKFMDFVKSLGDSYTPLDEHLTFANTPVRKDDYASKRLPYALEEGDISAYDEIMSTLYDKSEREKIEWVIGAIVSGDSKFIQKFLVFFGEGGSGKSTVLNIIQKLFQGYWTTFEAKAITSSNNSFAMETFKGNPLVAIQHDGDLSRIEDNTKLNSLVSHEDMLMNEKFKAPYTARFNAFLIMGTNTPVKITDAKSGLIRRLIDVHANDEGRRLSSKRYHALMGQVDFELGAIAYHCLQVYKERGKNYYAGYKPTKMMYLTDVFYNFVESIQDELLLEGGITASRAYLLYKQWCDESLIEHRLPQHKFREELKSYFHHYDDRARVNGQQVRKWFSGFRTEKFTVKIERDNSVFPLVMEDTTSLFDHEFADAPAQYASASEIPSYRWDDVTTTLKELDTTKIHYVRVPENHIVIDFDLRDDSGEKSAEKNLEAASKWPVTYSEYSKGGGGIHLHYNYDGDVSKLKAEAEPGVEIKVYSGKSSLRRRLSKCNSAPIATISEGTLPVKEEKVLNEKKLASERGLRALIERNLRKEIMPGTKPSIDFIEKILEEAYSGKEYAYDVTDMRQKILTFAMGSTNQAQTCIKKVQGMKFKSEDLEQADMHAEADDSPIVFYDVEVFKNLLIICWKALHSDHVVRMINPSPTDVEQFAKMKLVGFNCRRYDNHILYARILGYSNQQLYDLSQKIINDKVGFFGEAYGLSYADIYDFTTLKQGLKQYQIDLGLKHEESELPWDEPVPGDRWKEVEEYCVNDVISTEKVFLARYADFEARLILAELSGLSPNDGTARHTAKILFGNERNPQRHFHNTDLSEMFEGYTFDMGKSHYRGEEVNEGGYVYAEPGMYTNVALLDIASMHPTSIEQLDFFGPYTENFSAIKNARLAIKRRDLDSARQMLGGKLAPFLEDEEKTDGLSYALKIAINTVYGLTMARFDTPFKPPWNKDNQVAKRGALFMVDLKKFLQDQGIQVIHIKTDSIKIPDATPAMIEMVMEFGERYGYEFEHEATYERFCLVNDAVYVAKVAAGRKPAYWTATGAQFKEPYVFKTMFSKEPVEFKDLCQAKSVVNAAMYLDFGAERPMYNVLQSDKKFIGKVGNFVPVKEGTGGGILLRKNADGKFQAVTGTKGHFWKEATMVSTLNQQDDIDMTYFETLVYNAKKQLEKYGDVTWFLSE